VVDDLDLVAGGVAQAQVAVAADVLAGLQARGAQRLLVLDHEADVAVRVRRLRAALPKRDELGAPVDERHPGDAAPQLELEVALPPGERLVEVVDLERDVVDPEGSHSHAPTLVTSLNPRGTRGRADRARGVLADGYRNAAAGRAG